MAIRSGTNSKLHHIFFSTRSGILSFINLLLIFRCNACIRYVSSKDMSKLAFLLHKSNTIKEQLFRKGSKQKYQSYYKLLTPRSQLPSLKAQHILGPLSFFFLSVSNVMKRNVQNQNQLSRLEVEYSPYNMVDLLILDRFLLASFNVLRHSLHLQYKMLPLAVSFIRWSKLR